MFPSHRIAFATLPLIVFAWATLSLLGGTAQTVEGDTSKHGLLIGLCTVTAAVMLGSRGSFRFSGLRKFRWRDSLWQRPGAEFRRHRSQQHQSSSGSSNLGWTISPEFRRVLRI